MDTTIRIRKLIRARDVKFVEPSIFNHNSTVLDEILSNSEFNAIVDSVEIPLFDILLSV